MSDTATTGTLKKLLTKKDGSTTADDLMAAYREETGVLARSQPRMALLKLIETGEVVWGTRGQVTLPHKKLRGKGN